MERTLPLLPPPPRRVGGDCPPRTEVDAEAEAEARARASKHRRKMQNRKNQRAHRLRNKAEGSGQASRPFQVERWRLDEAEELSSGSSAVISYGDEVPMAPPAIVFPLSTDHLLHLVQFNVFRAFVANKRTLNILLTGWAPKAEAPVSLSSCPIGGPYRDDTSVYPLNPNIPASLFPTRLQQTRLHSFFINLFPFPSMRDNLIRRDGRFDQWELLEDLFGEFMTPTPVGGSNPKPRRLLRGRIYGEDADDEVTTGRKGLVVWGEPHDIGSWEATPGFLAKWSWAVVGCHDLLAATNRWRMRRGEDPIRLP